MADFSLDADLVKASAARLLEGELLFPEFRAKRPRSKRIVMPADVVQVARSRPTSHEGQLLAQALFPVFFRNARQIEGILPCGRLRLQGEHLMFEEPALHSVRMRSRESQLRQLLAAAQILSRTHREGVVHMDLKPSHIISIKNGKVYLVDWDAALPWRLYQQRGGFGFCGTPRYMAPEQARGNLKSVSPAIDVFALGLILYEILHRRSARPSAESLQHAIKRARDETVECEETIVRRFPLLAELCDRALEREPKRRPPQAEAFYKQLENVLGMGPTLS